MTSLTTSSHIITLAYSHTFIVLDQKAEAHSIQNLAVSTFRSNFAIFNIIYNLGRAT